MGTKEKSSKKLDKVEAKDAKELNKVRDSASKKVSHEKAKAANTVTKVITAGNKRLMKTKEGMAKKFVSFKDKLEAEANVKQVQAAQTLEREAEKSHATTVQRAKELQGKAKAVSAQAQKPRLK